LGFVPLLLPNHGGGPDAVLEPLNELWTIYRQLMMQYYGAWYSSLLPWTKAIWYGTGPNDGKLEVIDVGTKKLPSILNCGHH